MSITVEVSVEHPKGMQYINTCDLVQFLVDNRVEVYEQDLVVQDLLANREAILGGGDRGPYVILRRVD